MVRMSLFSAWAGLQIATAEHRYLVDVVKPHVARLTPLWLASLTEFARLRFEPDISSTSGVSMLSQNLDTMYAALNRETLLKVDYFGLHSVTCINVEPVLPRLVAQTRRRHCQLD